MFGPYLARTGLAGALASMLAVTAGAGSAEQADRAGFAVAAAGAAALDASALVPSAGHLGRPIGPAAGLTTATMAIACAASSGSIAGFPAGVGGAVSATHGVIVARSGFVVYDRSNPLNCMAAPVRALTDADLFGQLSPAGTETFHTPKVAYDTSANRFVIAALSTDPASGGEYINYAISADSTAAQWSAQRALASPLTRAIPGMPESE